jgi:hypothetical protein
MNMTIALSTCGRLLAFAMLIQAVEYIILTMRPSFSNIWSDRNVLPELKASLPLNSKIVSILFSATNFKKVVFLQVIAAIITLVFPVSAALGFLFITHLIICIRFRGTFNGGSDMMTFVVLTGMIVAACGFEKAGLVYIAIHSLYSYFKSGLAKAKHREWWNGLAIPTFLNRSIYKESHRLAGWFTSHGKTSAVMGWGVVLFELSALALVFIPLMSVFYFALALAFHIGIYMCFGLNRFLWIWLSTWPAILYSLTLL